MAETSSCLFFKRNMWLLCWAMLKDSLTKFNKLLLGVLAMKGRIRSVSIGGVLNDPSHERMIRLKIVTQPGFNRRLIGSDYTFHLLDSLL